MDCMNSMGFDQHDFTHNTLYPLKLISSESLDGLKISNARTDIFGSFCCQRGIGNGKGRRYDENKTYP